MKKLMISSCLLATFTSASVLADAASDLQQRLDKVKSFHATFNQKVTDGSGQSVQDGEGEMWDTAPKGRWMHRLIKDVETWCNRKHGNVDFYLTQLLSGHGCFREYLYKYGHDEAEMCSYCGRERERECTTRIFPWSAI